MIIPPDPEKNPDHFSASSSTPSLVPPPSEASDLTIPAPVRHRNRAFGYPFSDDLGVGFTGEALPPYARRVSGQHDASAQEDVFADPPRPHSILIPQLRSISPESDASLTPIASISTAAIPHLIPSPTSTTATVASSSKIWEGAVPIPTSTSRGKRRALGIFPTFSLSNGFRRWWKRYRRWVYAAIVVFLISLGLMIGLLVGLKVGGPHKKPPPPSQPWSYDDPDGKKTTINWSGDSNMNLTYDQSRDGPYPPEGNMTLCNNFTLRNSSSDPFSSLSVPFPAVNLWVQTFDFPITTNLTQSGIFSDFTITAQGLGSSGSVDFVGTEAIETVVDGGIEGFIRVDVVVRYSGSQNLSDMMRVCQMVRNDGSQGVGIYTAQETDGRASNPYMLNPLDLPSIQVVIRFPPSYVSDKSPSLWMSSVQLSLERAAVRVGDLQNVAEYGVFNVTSGRGGLVAGYLAATDVTVSTGYNSIRGTFNVSSSLSLNSTEGSILANVILHDATNSSAQGITVSPGSLSYRDIAQKPIIQTTFYTTEGLIGVSYLSQPANVALSSLIYTCSGDIDVALHPNYIGPFLVKDIWGQVRLATPAAISADDPGGLGRSRCIITGPLLVDDSTVSAEFGLNATVLAMSGKWISGMAYWVAPGSTQAYNQYGAGSDSAAVTAQEVQSSLSSADAGNQVIVIGAWGDVSMSFDGS